MRKPERLDSLYETMKRVHKEMVPDWRFGQLMSNFFGWVMSEKHVFDIFFPEDNRWEEWIIEYANSGISPYRKDFKI